MHTSAVFLPASDRCRHKCIDVQIIYITIEMWDYAIKNVHAVFTLDIFDVIYIYIYIYIHIYIYIILVDINILYFAKYLN